MIVEIWCWPEDLHDETILQKKIKRAARQFVYSNYQLTRRWIDARNKPKYRLRYQLFIEEKFSIIEEVASTYQDVRNSPEVHIIGAGPAGYFAALECLIHGYKPIIWEQGKDAQSRRRDLKAIQQDHVVNAKSNYCFGEGGAGTYSDGKLYTRAKKRKDIEEVLQLLVDHGAHSDILIDAHPHIGSNKLPNIIMSIRVTIEKFGGHVHFDTQVTDIEVTEGKVKRIEIDENRWEVIDHLILATGHSARSIYRLFAKRNWEIHAKPFAIGVRIEHPQYVIDKIQYGIHPRPDNLPAASYGVACEVDDRGVFSFCMCPGGLIVPSATAPQEIVVNGMSLSRRDSPYANSGFVVAVEPDDLEMTEEGAAFRCLRFQEELEQKMFSLSGSQRAPAQRVIDFISGKASSSLPSTSYIPGLIACRLDQALPIFIVNRMKEGLIQIERKMPGYIHKDAIMVGIESRTSAPIKIPRDARTLQHPQIDNLFPCGEGAGYAGGIMSAALDGKRVVRALNSKQHHADFGVE